MGPHPRTSILIGQWPGRVFCIGGFTTSCRPQIPSRTRQPRLDNLPPIPSNEIPRGQEWACFFGVAVVRQAAAVKNPEIGCVSSVSRSLRSLLNPRSRTICPDRHFRRRTNPGEAQYGLSACLMVRGCDGQGDFLRRGWRDFACGFGPYSGRSSRKGGLQLGRAGKGAGLVRSNGGSIDMIVVDGVTLPA